MHAKLPRSLELLVRSGILQVSEAELGDILEDYSRGRSRWWFWMQIFSLARRATMFSNLRSDIRYGLRTLSQNPGFTLAAVLTIALGIGINTGFFSILNSLALRPLRVPDGGHLVSIYQQFRGAQKRSVSGSRSMFSTPEYRNYRDRTQTLSGVMGFAARTLYMGVGGGAGWLPLEVIGVAKDAEITRIAETPSSYMYLPAGSRSQRGRQQLLVRSRTDFSSTASAIQSFARELDPGLVVRVNRLEENLDYWRTISRFATSMSASLGALALLIASIGVYGVVSYVVSRRRREVGIRLVLGATTPQVQRMIVKQTLRPVVIGMVVGIAAAAAVSRILGAVLFGVSAFDPIAFVVAPLFVLVVALAASVAPARKAMRVDPMSALRYE